MPLTEGSRPAVSVKKKEVEEMQEIEVVSLEGAVIKKDGQLVLLIPLSEGGQELRESSRAISDVEGDYLKIVIPEWLAGMLQIEEGDLVCVNNLNRKFNILAVSPRPVN
jgi:hypothetical protein